MHEIMKLAKTKDEFRLIFQFIAVGLDHDVEDGRLVEDAKIMLDIYRALPKEY